MFARLITVDFHYWLVAGVSVSFLDGIAPVEETPRQQIEVLRWERTGRQVMRSSRWRDSIVNKPPVVEYLSSMLPDAPGWGVVINEQMVRAPRLTGCSTATRPIPVVSDACQ